MVKIINQIDKSSGLAPRTRKLEKISKLVVHRIGASVGRSGLEVSDAFRDTSKYAPGSYTGGQLAYHFIIREDGTVDQCLRLRDVGLHAAKFNTCSIGIALVATHETFTKYAPTPEQWESLISLCRLLAAPGVTIHGHTELGRDATSDPTKDCPGPMVDLDTLRSEVASLAVASAVEAAEGAGVTA